MKFLIAVTFSDSLTRLDGNEQKAVKTTAFDLQVNPAHPGLSFHKLTRARDKNFWSVRVSSDIRIIVHKTDDSLLLCYVDHHDKAYEWAERRKLAVHPKTGAAQIVEIRETVQEIVVPVYVEEKQDRKPKPAVFSNRTAEELLVFGVPEEWIDEVLLANEDSLLQLVDHLPSEAAEALLELATGGTPRSPEAPTEDPFEHPDAKRRFRSMEDSADLERALEFPWEKWTVFLHPEQQDWVGRQFNGPARVSGSAGTGKTIVALHRAVSLAKENPDARVLLATFSNALADSLRVKLRRLIGTNPRLGERIDVHSLDELGIRLFKANCGSVLLAGQEEIADKLARAAQDHAAVGVSRSFLTQEWEQVIDAWQLASWEEYRGVARLGRKTRLPQSRREELWKVFEGVRSMLAAEGKSTHAEVFTKLAEYFSQNGHRPYDFSVIDEAQDLSVAQLRFFAALGGGQPNRLFFAGDQGQRIFQAPFSWKSLGVDIRGRSRNLRVNYRTSHQIRAKADKLLGPEVVDVDGNREGRSDTVSVFNGPNPEICIFSTPEEECAKVTSWLLDRATSIGGSAVLGVIVRSETELPRAMAAVEAAELLHVVLDEGGNAHTSGIVTICTMHLAKGLEFSEVAVMACDDEVIPLQSRIEAVGDPGDLQEVYDTERHLLYVACTRARDGLLVTGVAPGSEFLEDMA